MDMLSATVFFDKSGRLLEVAYATFSDVETEIVQKALAPLFEAAAVNEEGPEEEAA